MTLLKGGAKQRTHRARFHGWLINRCLNCNIPDRARATQINRAQYYRAAYVYFAIRNIFQKVSPRLFCFFFVKFLYLWVYTTYKTEEIAGAMSIFLFPYLLSFDRWLMPHCRSRISPIRYT
jgi:hypothetical protein